MHSVDTDAQLKTRLTDSSSAKAAALKRGACGVPAALAELCFQRDVERLCRLPPRVTYELLVAVGARFLIRQALEEMVHRFAAVDSVLLRAVGADRFPSPTIHLVDGDR